MYGITLTRLHPSCSLQWNPASPLRHAGLLLLLGVSAMQCPISVRAGDVLRFEYAERNRIGLPIVWKPRIIVVSSLRDTLAAPLQRSAYQQQQPVYQQQPAYQQPLQMNVHQTTVVQQRRDFPHILHLVLTIITCGAWLPIWIIHYLISQ